MSVISLIRDDIFNDLVGVFDEYDNIFSGKSYTAIMCNSTIYTHTMKLFIFN